MANGTARPPELRWSPGALRDLEGASDYIAADNPTAALELVARIEADALMLTRFPRMGRPGAMAGTRERPVPRTPYTLIYSLAADVLVILAVMHQRRQWPPGGEGG